MYSDETTEGDNDNSGPAPKKPPVARSSSEMSDQMTRLSGNGERRASAMSAQVSLPDDAGSGSVRGSITGSATGYATTSWCPCHLLRCHKFTDVTSCLASKIDNMAENCMPSRAKKQQWTHIKPPLLSCPSSYGICPLVMSYRPAARDFPDNPQIGTDTCPPPPGPASCTSTAES